MPFQKGHKGFRKKGEFKHSNEAKIKMSNSRKKYLKTHNQPMFGKHHSEETKRKISLANKGKIFSIEHRKNISIVQKGKIMSEEAKRKISISHLGSKNPMWKGGKAKLYGYIFIKQPFHPNCNKQKYVKRAILVMEKYLNRFLKFDEIVHHINGIKNDDRIENLKLFKSNSEHIKFHWDNGLPPF